MARPLRIDVHEVFHNVMNRTSTGTRIFQKSGVALMNFDYSGDGVARDNLGRLSALYCSTETVVRCLLRVPSGVSNRFGAGFVGRRELGLELYREVNL